MNWLEGYKTYIVAGVMILMAIAKGQGWISQDTYWEINGILVALGLSALRSGAKADAQTAATQAVTLAAECQDSKK